MGNFFVDLWDSIFTPGTTPSLIYATHGSFVCLVVLLNTLFFATKNYHFLGLLTISILLWGSITWFINELEKDKEKRGNTEQKVPQAPISSTSGLDQKSLSSRSRSRKT